MSVEQVPHDGNALRVGDDSLRISTLVTAGAVNSVYVCDSKDGRFESLTYDRVGGGVSSYVSQRVSGLRDPKVLDDVPSRLKGYRSNFASHEYHGIIFGAVDSGGVRRFLGREDLGTGEFVIEFDE